MNIIKKIIKNTPLETMFVAAVIVYIIGLRIFSPNYYPNEVNAKGELHPQLVESKRLDDWVKNHCDAETNEILDKIKWYSEYSGIKPEVVFAISWADTTCGKNLTTKNNYGNVGNADNGARRGFETPFAGWSAIVDTLNNKYIGGINKLGHLTQGGRNVIGSQYDCSNAPAPYKCYASSTYNWQKNTTRALSSMTGKRIDNNYQIRIK